MSPVEQLSTDVADRLASNAAFYVLSSAKFEDGHTNAVFVARCEASMIDDIILEVHNAGLELVTIHDRPEGSALGTYYYILEVECKEGIKALLPDN